MLSNTINPYDELLAYEALWGEKNASEKSIADLFRIHQNKLPSEVLTIITHNNSELYQRKIHEVESAIKERINGFSVSINSDFQYPEKLRDATNPFEVLYYVGNFDLVYTPCISIVGSRKVSKEGAKIARSVTRKLVKEDYTIVSGLALGVDTEAHTTCVRTKGKTIGVIGTPIDKYYPKENKGLQDEIKSRHLLISHIPFYRYLTQPFKFNRIFFPQRNATMAAISDATVIIEAGDTSGTLTQARACIQQKRPLFIMENVFRNPNLNWPIKYLRLGAIKVSDADDVLMQLERLK